MLIVWYDLSIGGRNVNPAPQSPLQVGRECRLRTLGREFLVQILGIARENVWISYPSVEVLCVGTGVDLEFHEDDGIIGYHARVAVVPSDPSKGIMLERCETAAHRAERRDWRVPTDLDVEIRCPGAAEAAKARMVNLTDSGTLLTTMAPFNAGDMVEVHFQLPDFAAHRLTAQVIYSDKTRANGINQFGLRFVDMNHGARNAITWFLYGRIQDLYPEILRDMYPPRSVTKIRVREKIQA